MSDRSRPDLELRLLDASPLSGLLEARKSDPEFARLRRLSSLFEQFHLKYTVTSGVSGRQATINGRQVLNFGSANYLGLEQHPAVLAASREALDRFGTHAGCSRVFSSHENMLELEEELSRLTGAEKTLVGHNISQIHAGVIPALFGNADSVLLIDRHAHTSMYQAALIAQARGARIVRVDVSDLPGLESLLRREEIRHGALLVDGVYSMQGTVPELPRLDSLCRRHGVILYVDDAHGVGVYGEGGGGVVEACALDYANVLLIGSLQKGVGVYGGFISGKAAVIDYLRVSSKAYIFSGTLQPAAVGGSLAALRVIRSEEGRRLRSRLREGSRGLRERLQGLGFTCPAGDSPILPVLIGSDLSTLMAGRKLFDEGIYLNSVLFPAVPRNQGVLRISLTTLHSESDLAALLRGFAALREYLDRNENPLRRFAHLALELGKAKLRGDRYAGL